MKWVGMVLTFLTYSVVFWGVFNNVKFLPDISFFEGVVMGCAFCALDTERTLRWAQVINYYVLEKETRNSNNDSER